MSNPPEKAPDWKVIEADYRLGVKSLRAIAAEHGITEGAIRQRAKRDEWTRDLSAKVKAKAEEKVRKAEVRTALRTEPAYQATERQQVEVAATLQASVILEHRQDIRRSRAMFQNLMSELERLVADPELFERLGELLDTSGETDDGRQIRDRLNEAYRKVISMPERVDSAKKLSEMLERVVKMERQAFGLDEKGGDGDDGTGGKTLTDAERAVRLLHFLKAGGAAA